MGELERVVEASALEPKLRELVKLRASQINGEGMMTCSTRALSGSLLGPGPAVRRDVTVCTGSLTRPTVHLTGSEAS